MKEPGVNPHFEASAHRTDATAAGEVQAGNQAWWTAHTMSYDWGERMPHERFTLPWFDEVDRRFVRDARLFGHDQAPFDRLIPFARLAGRRVLEVGCGMGLRTELLVRAGAAVTSIDLSPTSVEATETRLRLKGLAADVRLVDAEGLPFADRSFDLVWSWGVLHHSARTARAVREVARVTAAGGEARVMVYNRDSSTAWIALAKHHWLRGGALRGASADESLNRGSDGFHARHYTRDQAEDLFRAFFADVACAVCGQEVDALPLPRRLRGLARRLVSDAWLKLQQARRGWFLLVTAARPN